jgi:NodT family efflux transporter outer membrane factor (OMF) lipoprotein
MPHPTRPILRPAVAAAAMALSACTTVGPNFKTPEGPKGPAAAGYAMPGDPTPVGPKLAPEARAAGPWWQAFGSPELDAAVRQALHDSPTLAEAVATLERSQAEAAAVAGQSLPQVDANAALRRERINVAAFGFSGFPNPTIDFYSIGWGVTYDLDLWGRRRREVEEVRADSEAEARRADAAYLALSGNVVLQAVHIATIRAQIAAAQQIVADDARVVELVRNSVLAGGEAPAGIAASQAQLAEDEAFLPPLQRDLDAARHQMALLAGKAPAEWAPPEFDLAQFVPPGAVPVTLPSELVRRRPDILAAESELHSATAAVGVAVADQYPNLVLSANIAQSALKPQELFKYASTGWDFGGGLTAPIFHGGTLSAERRAAEAEARAAMARYQQTVLRAFTQVSDVLAALASDTDAIAALDRAEEAAARRAHNAETAYKLGGGTLFEVTDAHRQLSRIRRILVEAEGRRLSDFVELYTATAADWRTAS